MSNARRAAYLYTTPLLSFMQHWLQQHGYRRFITARTLYETLRVDHPHLLIDSRNREIGVKPLSVLLAKMAAEQEAHTQAVSAAAEAKPQSSIKLVPVDSKALALEKQVATAASALAIGERVIRRVFDMVRNGDVQTLSALDDLTRGGKQ